MAPPWWLVRLSDDSGFGSGCDAVDRHEAAAIPLPECPIPGFRACLIQAVEADRPQARAIRLTLYERLEPRPRGDDPGAA